MINYITLIGLLAGTLSIIGYLPQVWKTYTTKHARDLSMGWLTLTLSSAILWFTYGILSNSLPLTITSAFTATMNLSLIIMKRKYD
jgi:MtN3 and saliva related transmembrane protein